MIKIFLDDYRTPQDCLKYMHTRIGPNNSVYNDEWIVVKNYEEFKKILEDNIGNVSHVSFDHDLADEHYNPEHMIEDSDYESLAATYKERTGYDCASLLKYHYEIRDMELPIIIIHSMNPIGRKRIEDLFKP